MHRNPNLPVMEKLIKGRLYKLECRNLICGVWNGKGGFIGIRNKWGSRFLDKEYHWDQDPHCGTVENVEDTGIDLPEDIKISCYLGTKDELTDQWIERKYKENDFQGWCVVGAEEILGDVKAIAIGNPDLFKFLDKYIEENQEYLQTYIREGTKKF